MIAAAIVGPDIDRLVSFTRYSRKFVEVVSGRMRACGRWADGRVHIEHWFEDGKILPGFWFDCLIADGVVELGRSENGKECFRKIAKR